MRWMILALALIAMVPARAAPPSEFPNVTDSSFTEANGDRTIQLAVTIAAPPAKVFAAFSSPKGWTTWAAPFATGEARVGGIIETSYDPAARQGDAGNIQNQITAWLPDRLVVLRNIKAPADFPHADLYAQTATIIELTPEGAGTRVTLSAVGFRPGDGFDQLHKMFGWGNALSLENLKKAVEQGPIDWSKAAP